MNWSYKTFQELTTEELYQIYKVRTEVFVVEQTCAYQEVDVADKVATHVFLEDKERIIAYCRLIPKEDGIYIGRVLVAAQKRKLGLGRQLLNEVLPYIKEQWGNIDIHVQAQVYLKTFYESLGFIPYSESYLDEEIPHIDMKLEGEGIKLLGTKRIETERLILEQFQLEDAEKMYANWARDRDVSKFLSWEPHSSVEGTKQILKEWIALYDRKNYWNWKITLKEIQEPIGSLGAVEQDLKAKSVHIGYGIGSKWWNQGYTSEALRAVIQFFFEEVGVNRIEAKHDVRNPNSGKVMASCGMKYEGTLRKSQQLKGELCDLSYYGLLREDYLREE